MNLADSVAQDQPTAEHLGEMTEALQEMLGEEGITLKIVGDIRDCLALDAVDWIQAAASVDIILTTWINSRTMSKLPLLD